MVDDDQSWLDICRTVLDSRFDKIILVDNVNDAFKVFGKEKYLISVVLFDLRMPGREDGLDMVKKMRLLSPNTQFLMSTAYLDGVATTRAMCMDIYALPKSIETLFLTIATNKALQKYQKKCR